MIGQDFVNIRHTRVEIIIGMRVMAILPKVQWSNFKTAKTISSTERMGYKLC